MDGNKESKSKGNYTSPHLVLRGRMQMRVVRSEKVQPGEIGMGAAAVRSIDLGPGEALSLSAAEDGAERANVTLVAVPYPGKETALVHPETADALGLGAAAWVHAPFQPPGADAFRWLFYASSPPWTNTRLSLRAIREGQREFHLRLGNVFQFFSIYANISQFDPEAPRPRSAHLLDRWVRSEAAALVESVTAHLDGWRAYEAARALSAFVDGLSNWYVRRSRARFWGEGADTAAALGTLYDVLVVLSRLMAPFVPFMAEAMHQRLGRPGGAESVHLCDWPSAAAEDRDDALVADMALVREVVSLGLSARKAVGVRVRQPLRAAELILADATAAARLEPLLGLVQDELNVRAVHPSTAAERFVTFTVKANFARLGKRLGKDMKACAAALQAADPAAVRRGVLAGGYGVALPGGEVVLTEEDVLVGVEPKAGFQAAGSAAAVVVLHADLDDDLREEGLYREVLNRVQGRRKDLGLGYTDRIRVAVTGSAALVQAVQRFAGPLAQEALAVGVSAAEGPGVEEVDGHAFQLEVARA
jgi:isoleucyl-tRNA synthetase